MPSLHCQQSLVDQAGYCNCRVYTAKGASLYEIAIPARSYADLHELIAALSEKFATRFSGGYASLDASGIVTIGASENFRLVTDIQPSTHTALLDLLGFNTATEFSEGTNHTADRTPTGLFHKDFFSDISTEEIHVEAHHAQGYSGQSISFAVRQQRQMRLQLDYLTPLEVQQLQVWMALAADGRVLRLYENDAVDFLSCTLDQDFIQNPTSWLKRQPPQSGYFRAQLSLRKESA